MVSQRESAVKKSFKSSPGLRVNRKYKHAVRIKSSPDLYIQEIKNGNPVFLADAISLFETDRKLDQPTKNKILEVSARSIKQENNKPFSPLRIGVSGAALFEGGRSLVETIGLLAVEKMGFKLAVLSVDQSFHRSNGCVLTRGASLSRLAQHERVFFRSFAMGENLIQTALALRSAIFLCEMAGYDCVLIEGGGEEFFYKLIREMVDCLAFVTMPGLNTALGIGFEELADIVVVAGVDGVRDESVVQKQRFLQNSMMLFPRDDYGWMPRVLTFDPQDKFSHEEIWRVLALFFKTLITNDGFEKQRQKQLVKWLRYGVMAKLHNEFFRNQKLSAVTCALEEQLQEGKLHLEAAVEQLMTALLAGFGHE